VRILIDRLGDGEGLDRGREDRPEGLLIDRVLASRRGHPLLLAVVYAAVARRAGFDLHPVGNERMVLLGDNDAAPPLALDPVPGGRRPPSELRWLCPHVVGAMMLGALAVRWRQHGQPRLALRALELRLLLPVAPALRARHEHELRAARAQLN
jgi:regulator of sirC expression with transglutaminase-like and TPR domain